MKAMHPLQKLIEYTPKWRKRIFKASSYSTANKIFDIAPEILIGVAVDLVVRQEKSFLSTIGLKDPFFQLLVLGGITIIIWAFESIFEFLYATEWRNLAQDFQHHLRQDSYKHLQKLDLAWMENKSSGDILAVINDDVNQLERFLDNGLNEIIQVIVSSSVIAAIFFYISPLVACFAILPIPLILMGSRVFQKKLGEKYIAVRNQAGLLNSRLNNNLQGIATIKSYATEKQEAKAIEQLSNAYQKSNQTAIRLSSAFIPIIRIAILSGFVVTLVLGGKLTMDGNLAIGSYSILIFLTQRLLWPFTRLGQTLDLFQRSMASIRRIFNLLETPFSIKDKANTRKLAESGGKIEFKNVDFSYQEQKILNNLQLTVHQGEYVGIVGTTGAGKSTLVKLLLRFYEPQNGSICIADLNIQEYSLNSLRQSIAMVSQDAFMLDDTIHANILYGYQGASEEEVIEAAKLAEVHDFISELPQGYQTQVGERGVKLSGGQKQRISIARALLKNSPILILDEATSAVDNETEAAIQRSLDHIKHSRSIIVIAHRLSTIRNADRIHVLENGEIKESGTHAELIMNKTGTYKRLWDIQTGQTLLQ